MKEQQIKRVKEKLARQKDLLGERFNRCVEEADKIRSLMDLIGEINIAIDNKEFSKAEVLEKRWNVRKNEYVECKRGKVGA